MENEYLYASMGDAICKENILWFSNHMFNALCKYDMTSGIAEIIGTFPNANIDEKILHRKAIEYQGNYYFFLNHNMKGLHKYSPSEKEIVFIDRGINTDIYYASDIILLNDCAYIFPRKVGSGVYMYIFAEECFRYLPDFFSELIHNNILKETDEFFRIFHKNDTVFLPVYGTNCIIKYVFSTRNIQMQYVDSNIKISDVYIDNKGMWITQVGNSEICYVQQDYISKYYVKDAVLLNELEKNRKERNYYSRIVSIKQETYILPMTSPAVLKVNQQTGTIEALTSEKVHESMKKSVRKYWTYYYGYSFQKNMWLIYPDSGGLLLKMNIETEQIESHAIMFDRESESLQKTLNSIFQMKLKETKKNNKVLIEDGEIITLENFVKSL